MVYPTNAQINTAVPAAGTPNRGLTNSVLQSLVAALPKGTTRQVVAFNEATQEMEAKLFTADMWSEFPGGAPTTGIWLAAYIPESEEVMGFGEVSPMAEENTIPVRTSQNGIYTAGRLKAAPGMDPDDCITVLQGLIRAAVAPTSATSEGEVGDFFVDADYVYICRSINSWVRIPTAAW